MNSDYESRLVEMYVGREWVGVLDIVMFFVALSFLGNAEGFLDVMTIVYYVVSLPFVCGCDFWFSPIGL